jgi:hypothetical protein
MLSLVDQWYIGMPDCQVFEYGITVEVVVAESLWARFGQPAYSFWLATTEEHHMYR